MHIKRNYNQPFFREKRKRGYGRAILVALLLMGGLVWYVFSQPAAIMNSIYALMGAQPTPTPLPSDLVAQAFSIARTGDLEGAALIMAQAVEQRPDQIDYLYEYGQILVDINRPDEALELADRIIAIDGTDARGFALRALALVWKGDAPGAIPVALAGMQYNNTFGPLYVALSRAYTGTAEWAQSQEYGLLAIEMAPGDVHSYWAYAHALVSVGAREEGMRELERAIEIQPNFLPPYFELGLLYLASDRDQEAIDLYDRILGIQPRNARALLRQCQAYRKVGQFERALGLCQDAVDSDPNYVTAQYQLGLLRYNRREFERARVAFQACIDQDPSSVECQYRLGLAHYYLAVDTSLDNDGAAATIRQHCEIAWTKLEESLVMLQAQNLSDGASVDIIREGLGAIASDPRCPAYSGRAPAVIPPPVDDAEEPPVDETESFEGEPVPDAPADPANSA